MTTKLYDEEAPIKKSETKEANLWHERVGISKKEQEQWAQDSGAKRFLKEYEGDYGITLKSGNRDVKVPPLGQVFSYVQTDISSTFNRDPYIEVNAKAGSVKGAALWEVIVNYYWRHLKTKEELELEIIDKDLVGYAWHKVGTTQDGKLYSSYLCWKDMLWNLGSKRPGLDSEWMAHRIVMPLKKIKKLYPAAKGMEGSPSPDVDDETYKKSSYQDDIKVGIIWEIWDKESREIILIAENLKDKFLAPKRPWPEYQVGFPFSMYWDFAVPNKPRPMSAIAPWEEIALAEMVLTAQQVLFAKRWNRQLFVKGGSVDDNALDKFVRGDDGAVITVNGNMDDSSFKFADFGQFPPEFMTLCDRLSSYKRNVHGQPEFAAGGVTKTNTRTIGELDFIQQGNQSRQGRKVDRLETHCENIANLMIANLKGNFDFEEIVRITGDEPPEIIEALGNNFDPVTQSVKFTPEEIAGEYDVEVKSGSTLPLDKQTKMHILEIVGQVIAQAATIGLTSNLVIAWLDEMLDGFDIKSLKEAYEADVIAQKEAEEKAQQEQAPDQIKTAMEAAKREAQARQITAETQIIEQDAQVGPIGRAQLERLKKDPLTPKPVGAR